MTKESDDSHPEVTGMSPDIKSSGAFKFHAMRQLNNSVDYGSDGKVPALDLSIMKRNQEYKDWYGLTKKLEAGLDQLR